MRRFVTAGTLALVVALFAGCSDQEGQTPTEPQFKPGNNKVSYDCEAAGLQEQLDALNEAVEAILMHRPTVKGALSNVDNMARKVCVEEPNYEAALEQYFEFEMLVNGQALDKLVGGEVARQALLDMAYTFASGEDYNPGFSIPPEALGDLGAVWVVPAGVAEELVVDDGDFALRVLEGTFPPDAGNVTIVAYRLPDDYAGEGDYSFAPYDPLPEIWWVETSVQLVPLAAGGDGLEVWECLLDDTFINSAVIAHALDEGGVELLPRLDGPPPAGFDCDNADDYPVIIGANAPGWLKLAGSVVQPVLSRLVSVRPLHAMYFKGTGLGGRAGSVSPFAPVIPVPAPAIEFDSRELNTEVSPGVFENRYFFNTTNAASFPNELFAELTPGTECPSRTIVSVYDAANDALIASFDCWVSSSLAAFSFSWPSFSNPPDDVYIELWDQLLDVTYRSNTVAIPIVFNTLTVAGAGTGSGYIPDWSPYFQNCRYDGAQTTGDCTGEWEEWVRVSGVTAIADEGSTFEGWSGACTGIAPCTVWMDAHKSLTATFTADEVPPAFSLSLNVAAGGTVSDSKGNGPCGPAETCDWGYLLFDAGESLVLTATPDVGYYTAWDAACTNVARDSCNLDPVATMSASADFIFTPTLTVTVTSVPDGNAGDPVAGDDYGHSCSLVESPCTWSYPDLEGATITLAVTPDDAAPGFPVMDISGACTASGSGGTPVSCSFTATGAKTATVNVNHGV
jgi:hypothetical protein